MTLILNQMKVLNFKIIFIYLHIYFYFRIGRTGRFGKTGLAINLVESPKSMAVLKDIEKHFQKE